MNLENNYASTSIEIVYKKQPMLKATFKQRLTLVVCKRPWEPGLFLHDEIA